MTTCCCTRSRMNLVIIGMPGSGKGTQSKKIADCYEIKHITSGELLRNESKKSTKNAKIIKELLGTGQLLPDSIVNEVVAENKPECDFILDGYPRKISQAERLSEIDLVIFIDLPEEEAVKRILKRKDGRSDDNEEAVKIRLKEFGEQTEPVINWYKEKGILEIVDGRGTEEDVFSRIKELIFKKLNI